MGWFNVLAEASDVDKTPAVDGDILLYDDSVYLWVPTSLSTYITTLADTTYLKLDCANDPLTGNLSLGANDLSAGTGTFSDAGTSIFTEDIDIGGATGVNLSAANGVLTLAGLGDGADENLTIDFNTTANTVAIGTGTGVTTINWNALNYTSTGWGRFDGGLGIGGTAQTTQGIRITKAFVSEGGSGIKNMITVSGDDKVVYGIENNTISVTGTASEGTGIYNSILSSVGTGQELYGVFSYISPHASSVESYGEYIWSTTTTINDPSLSQIGIYINWRIPGTDTNNKRWTFYNDSSVVNAAKIFLGKDDIPTYWGTGYDALIKWTETGSSRLMIDAPAIDFDTATLVTTGTLGAGATTLSANSTTALKVNDGLGKIVSTTIASGGTGYTVNDVLTITGGDGNATVVVLSVSGGVVNGLRISAVGTGYSTASTVATTGGTGANCTLNINVNNVTIDTTNQIFGFGGLPTQGALIEGGGVTGRRTGLKIDFDDNSYGPTIAGYCTNDATERIFFRGTFTAGDDQNIYFASGSRFSIKYNSSASQWQFCNGYGTNALMSFSTPGGVYDATADVAMKVTSFTFIGKAETDIPINFTGTTNSGLFTWMEDEGVFKWSNGRAYTPSDTLAITAATGLTAATHLIYSIVRIQGNGGAVDITANPQIADGIDGQVLIIQGDSNTNTVTFEEGTGLALNAAASFIMGKGDILQLTYDAGDDLWYEISRSVTFKP